MCSSDLIESTLVRQEIEAAKQGSPCGVAEVVVEFGEDGVPGEEEKPV